MEELLVSTLQDVELWVVEYGVLVHGPVSLAHEAAHPRAALRRELAVEDDDHAFVYAGWCDGSSEEEILHMVLLVQVKSSLMKAKNWTWYQNRTQADQTQYGIREEFMWGITLM